MNLFACLSLCFFLAMQSSLNSTLMPPKETLERMWQEGYERARTDKTLYRAHKSARKVLGRMNGQPVSWVTFLHPRLLAFEKGFVTRKENLDPVGQAESRASLVQLAQDSEKHLYFYGEIGIYPKFRGGRKANPNHLSDIRVQMQVGSRIYLPKQQPGDLDIHVVHGVHHYTEDGGSYTDDKGNTVDLPDISMEEKYVRYEGTFDVTFDLYDTTGKPVITEEDKEISIVVIGKFGRQKTTFRLKDWLDYYEK